MNKQTFQYMEPVYKIKSADFNCRLNCLHKDILEAIKEQMQRIGRPPSSEEIHMEYYPDITYYTHVIQGTLDQCYLRAEQLITIYNNLIKIPY